ncbi:MAG: hypothetical protein JNK69_09755 [Saprospiraceae bacterium]|nr:hypothetical protein [Saprospiraceae bacterium]MCC6841876.1 hypothetical protein [Saprospiraceae bacterium]
MKIKCLFWNINRKASPFENVINDITKDIDILVLAEAENINDTSLCALTGFHAIKSSNIHDHSNLTPKVYAKPNGFSITHLNTAVSKRMVLNLLKVNGHEEIIFSGIHFPSKLEYSSSTQESIANSYAGWINEVENLFGLKRTILVGDFNMNPFEGGMIKPKTFNATLSKNIAETDLVRRFHFEDFDYFYNPMWNFMGDVDYNSGMNRLPGSYYFRTTTDDEAIYWNVIDKVIARPEVIKHLNLSSIEFPMSINGHVFMDVNYDFDSINYSDHLPLKFELKF